ncbi:fimbrial protein [Enterobacter kobei]|uniref:fimbrial protein n=1 Tax=Enterobacter kobei TaxID=208224 RepID=UPI003CF30081
MNIRILFCGVLLLTSKMAVGACSFMDNRFTASDNINLNFGQIIVQRDTPIGSVVATASSATLANRNDFIECTTSRFVTQWAPGSGNFQPVQHNAETLYQSGVAGLAFRVVTPGAGSTAGRYGTGPLPRRVSNIWCRLSPTWWRLCGGSWGNYQLQLIKIAPVTGSGRLQTGSITRAGVVGEMDVMNVNIASGEVHTVACSVTTPNIFVNMGSIKNTEFSRAGSTSRDVSFNVNLNCDASANIYLTLEAGRAGVADTSKGILNIDTTGSGETASGVGIQVLFNHTPVIPGERLKITTTASDGLYALPLAARYYQTGTILTPGTANATATFTTTYQ